MRRTLLFILLIPACASLPPPAPKVETPVEAAQRRAGAAKPAYNLAGYPPAFRDGYIDGCETAKASDHAWKDDKRFAADAQYKLGWNDGHSLCRKR